MKRRFVQCDVFSDVALRGNGLAVVLDGDGLSDDQMQRFAIWTRQAETSFVQTSEDVSADYRLRIFSATREMPFAGHPTLGSAAAWLHAGGVPKQAGRVMQDCMIGLVEIDLDGPVPAFVAPFTQVTPMPEAERARICAALGIERGEVRSSVQLDNGVLRNLLELESAARVLSLDAATVSLPAFQGVSLMGAHAEGAGADFETRNLTPASLMEEDPITGSMNAAIAVWLQREGRLDRDIVIAQGTAMGCEGRVFVRQRDGDVMIGGQSTIVIEGVVDL